MSRTVSLKSLEEMGYTLEFFYLESSGNAEPVFSYYTFDEQYRPELLDVWDVIGLHQHSEERWLLDMRLMHIDLEMFDRGEFVALRDAPEYLSLSPSRLQALISFLDGIAREATTQVRTVSENRRPYFYPMNTGELRNIHLPMWKIPYLKEEVYRYVPDNAVQSNQEISVFKFPQWSSKHGVNQVTTLKYDVFHSQELAEPKFEVFGSFGNTHGVRTVTFDLHALKGFLSLLGQHSYENFVHHTE